MKKNEFDDTIKLADEIIEYYYKNPDEEKAPSPPHENNLAFIDENGNMTVNNVAAFWLPEFEIEDEEKSVKYVVDGTYDGKSFLHNKLKRIIDNVIDNLKSADNGITGQEGNDNE
ncbi:MAG: hypothetical protein IKH13_00415 [Clostridia bacterium]|nr:hypothetical protein [Clostridia bacterium]